MWRSRPPQRRPLLDLRNWIDRAQTPSWVEERRTGSITEMVDIDRRVGSTLESLPREDGGYQDAKDEASHESAEPVEGGYGRAPGEQPLAA